MMWKALAAIYRNVLAYIIASMAAGLTLSTFVIGMKWGARYASQFADNPFRPIAVIIAGGSAVATGVAMIAWILALPGALIGHYVKRGQMLFYGVYGTFAGLSAAFVLRSGGAGDDPVVGPLLAYGPVSCAGLVAGLTYWLIAERKA